MALDDPTLTWPRKTWALASQINYPYLCLQIEERYQKHSMHPVNYQGIN